MSTPFYDLASLVVVPSGYKTSKIYAQKPLTTDGQLAFTRSTTATRVNSAGLIEASAINVPRLDYLGSTCPRLLLEPQRTNKQTFSEQINTTNYSLSNEINVTANSGVSPDGYTNADKIIPTTTSAYHQVRSGLATANGYDIVSVFVKASGYNYVQLASWADPTNYVNFDLTDGTVGTVSVATVYGIQSYGNGWYRVWANVQASGGGLVGIGVVTSKTAGWAQAFAGNGTDGVLMWGVQIEAGAYATSYIPTLGAAVTRGADAASKTGISSLIGQTEGTLFADIDLALNGDAAGILGVFGTGTTFIYLFTSTITNKLNANCYSSAVEQAAMDYTLPSAGRYKIAFGYKANDFVLYVNGVQRGSDNTGSVPACTDLRIDEVPTYNILGNSKHRQALLFKTRLTNAQLAELTTI